MKRILFLSLVISSALVLFGCNTQTATSAAVRETRPPAPTKPADLTLDQVKNAEYSIVHGDKDLTFALVDGSYQNGSDTSSSDYYQVTLSDKVAFGDLNADGIGDAAVSIGISSGGTGVFEYLVAFVNESGLPVQDGYFFVDDRARIDVLDIKDQKIVADAMVHAPNDPMCCPTMKIQASFQLPFNDSPLLVKVHQTSEIVPGAFREITISSPEPGSEVDQKCTITGDVTIAPFENNLVYHVYDLNMNEIQVGPLMVIAPDMGAPGTFELNLDLSSTGYSGQIFVTISDLSAADGSTLALGTIFLMLK